MASAAITRATPFRSRGRCDWPVARQGVHDWLRRFANGGVGAPVDKSSGPDSFPHRITPPTEAMVIQMHRDHRAWGPSRLR